MAKTLTYKILEKHLAEGDLVAGEAIGIRIDQTLTQDATGTTAFLLYESMGIGRVKTDVSVSYIDHNMSQFGPENHNDHLYLQTVATRAGVYHSRAGNGICHQVHLERFGRPGATLLGSDSHTPTAGGIGMLAIGAGGMDVAVAMGGGLFYLTCPKVIGVNLTGKLPEWVAAKDVILKVLSILSTRGNVGCVIEYFGEGVKTLSVPQRATITNMGAESGDLSRLEPLAACPSSPDNIKPVAQLAGTKTSQVVIGSCTNSSFTDLMMVAKVLKDRHIDGMIEFAVAPGSRQVLAMLAKNGALADMIAAGARILESGCGPCIGQGFSPADGVVTLRTFNRNFPGRTGTAGDKSYLVSPETAVASAIMGEITDPRTLKKLLGIRHPRVKLPDRFLIDDSMIERPLSMEKAAHAQVIRGATIVVPESPPHLPDRLEGVILLKCGDKITTDHIMPAGAFLKYRSNVPEYSKVVFNCFNEPGKETFAQRCLALKAKGLGGIIVAGTSYGQGSSREHAALCPMYLGVRVVIARSIERIHKANLINFAIVPLEFSDAADYDRVNADDELEIDGLTDAIRTGDKLTVRDKTGGFEFDCKLDLSTRDRAILLAAGLGNYTRKRALHR